MAFNDKIQKYIELIYKIKWKWQIEQMAITLTDFFSIWCHAKKNWLHNSFTFLNLQEGIITYFLIYLLTYLLAYLITYSMEQSPFSEAHPFSTSQEIPRILCNPNVHYQFYRCPPPAPILIHINPVHVPHTHFLKILLNIILPSIPGSSKWFLSLRFSPPKPCIRLSSSLYALHAPPIS